MPELAEGLREIGSALGTPSAQAVCDRIYPALPATSIDYGVMERTSPVLTVPGDFGWNDVGTWTALPDYQEADEAGNVVLGKAVTHDASNNIIVADEGRLIALAGVSNMIVVQSGDAVLMVPRDRAQDVRALLDKLDNDELKDFL
jgi:mannose-1-phosphate guanylyltransferase